MLIVCTGNSARSQTAEGLIGKERISAFRRLRDKIHARVMVFLGEGAYSSREAG